MTQTDMSKTITLALGASGKTGRRVALGLEAKGLPVRRGSRSAYPPFDCTHEEGWDACLVLSRGRGEEEAQACERVVMESGIPATAEGAWQ